MKSSPVQSKYLEQGLQRLRDGDLKAALKEFEQGEHWLEAAKVAQRLKKNSKAIEYFSMAKNFSAAANIHLTEGDFNAAAELFLKDQAYSEAALALEQHLNKKYSINRANSLSGNVHRDARTIIKEVSSCYLKAGNFDPAAVWLLVMGDKLKAAECFAKSGNHGKAAVLYEDQKKLREAGGEWSKAGDFYRAAEAFKKGEHLVEAGQAFEQADAYDAAIVCYRRVKKFDLAGKLAMSQQHVDQAATFFEEGNYYLEAAQCYRQLQSHDKVIEVLLKMPKKDPNYNKGCLLLIDACLKQGNITFQVDDYLKEFLLLPFTVKTLKIFFELGQLYEKLEFYESARDLYSKVAAVDENYTGIKERQEYVNLQITGTPMTVRKILDDDFGYKATSERLAGYQNRNSVGQSPVPASTEQAIPSKSADASIYNTSNFGDQPSLGSTPSAPTALDLRPGSKLFGRYKIIETNGSEEHGFVCRVMDQEIDDELILKILNHKLAVGEGLEKFKKEIKLSRKISHPNFVSIFDYGKSDGHHYITLESVSGRDLKSIIEKDGRLSLEKDALLIVQICEGLQAIHAQKIIHRALRPANIKIRDDGTAKILDFDLTDSTDFSSLTKMRDGEQTINVAYMSPEQIQGKALDERSDIYSLGIILYELFTEQLPFHAKELKSLIYQQLNDQPTPPSTINPGISADFQALIMKCIHKDPKQRYRNCGELLTEFKNVAGLNKSSATESGPRHKVINERYEIKSEIGRGGMGVVYRAFDQSLHREVALKFLPHELSGSGDDLNAFLNEARSAARLSHNNIVTIHNIEKVDKEYFIVMEFIDGVNIHDLLESMEKLPFKSVDLICRQVCDALDYAHKRKIFHRDIKSANILWTNDKIVKITDFGLAKIAEGALAASTRVQGSPAYMSPEQILGKNVDHRTDIYSLGVTLYEMVTGFVPFSKGDIAYHQMHTEATPVKEHRPDTPQYLQDIVHRCMRKSPDERFQTALEIVASLPK